MKIAVGADHAGFELKQHLVTYLSELGHEVNDLGTYSEDSVDYPDQAAAVSHAVAEGAAERGLLVCGTGLGMAIAANKVDGIRSVACQDLFCARMARAHNDINVLAVGGRITGVTLAEEIVRTFLETPFEDGRHQRRVGKIHALESSHV